MNGNQAVQFALDQGTTFWGHMLVDNAAVRVALTNGHRDLVKLGVADFKASVSAEPVVGREAVRLRLECPANASPSIATVEFQGWYDGYDENGNLQRKDWHGFTKKRMPVAMLGVAASPPFELSWETTMVPAQGDVAVRRRGIQRGHESRLSHRGHLRT